MKQIILFSIVPFFFTQMALSQIELDSAGRVGIGGVTPSSTYSVFVDGDNLNGLYVLQDGNPAGSTHTGTRTISYNGTNNYGLV